MDTVKGLPQVPVSFVFGHVSQLAARLDELRARAINEDDDPPLTFPKESNAAAMRIVVPAQVRQQLQKERAKKGKVSGSTLILVGIGLALLIKRL
jgi:hypothetical protein